ncbi:DUF4345 domain-containing protein [Altererythrobacter soli]|uniref:DUF4345 domain-containing protein n=1 Tax=Croceibacterium soli TaxID=1739690 RepID=A0A6I4US51_9SPHN|nr:DUF4345 family protein [Croceibacterium soli]MXP40614.1 DUF4345 domain-containing protein [Croceibacterium soli]
MRFVLTALAMIGGIVFTLIGLGFLIDPQGSAAGFGLIADGAPGLSTLRADMTSFFVVSGVCMIWGAWRRNGELLLVPAALFGIAFTGRLVSAIVDGATPGFWLPMLIEAAVVAITLLGSRHLPHEAVGEGH